MLGYIVTEIKVLKLLQHIADKIRELDQVTADRDREEAEHGVTIIGQSRERVKGLKNAYMHSILLIINATKE